MAQKSSDSTDLKVTVYWGDILYDTAVCKPNSVVSVGRGKNNTFILDVAESKKLLEVHPGGNATFYFDDRLDGHIRIDKELLSLHSARESKHATQNSDGQYKVELTGQDKADVVLGHVTIYFDWIKNTEKIDRTRFFEKRNLLLLLLLLISLGGIWAAIQWLTINEPEKKPERLVYLDPPKKMKSEKGDTPTEGAPSKAAIGETKSKDGGAAKGDLGKAQTKVVEKESAAASLKNANLGSLLNGLTKSGASAPHVNNTESGESAAIAQQGTGGFSTEGLKTGGGGKTAGIGRTSGQGEGGFAGTGRLGLYGNSATEGSGVGNGAGTTRVAGGLDRDVIESIIRRRLDRIRLCYERQLNFYPKLSGKITVHFVIGKSGNVVNRSIVDDTMRNASVSQCIESEVGSWNFPAPEGGTLVNVDYPFVFESTQH